MSISSSRRVNNKNMPMHFVVEWTGIVSVLHDISFHVFPQLTHTALQRKGIERITYSFVANANDK